MRKKEPIWKNATTEVFRTFNKDKKFHYTVKENGSFIKTEDNKRAKFDWLEVREQFNIEGN